MVHMEDMEVVMDIIMEEHHMDMAQDRDHRQGVDMEMQDVNHEDNHQIL